MNWERIGYGVIAVLSGTVLGALIGVGVIGRLFINSTGFGAIGDTLGYAFLGAVVAFLGLLYLAWHWPLLTLRRWAVGLVLGTVVLIGLLAWFVQRKKEGRDATSDLRPTTSAQSLPGFRLSKPAWSSPLQRRRRSDGQGQRGQRSAPVEISCAE